LHPALEWLQEHSSVVSTNVVVTHGDFHPFNILIDQGQISAVLDWQGWKLGEPEFDVTNTMVKMHCLASVHLAQYNWPNFIKRYVAEYHSRYKLNYEKLRFYQAAHCIRFYILITGGMPRVDHPQVRMRLLDHFQAITGIEISETS
jgi:aminoglycoside phosphotransferase (APT) family kinase protein